ncbi:sulfite exporter TauE/SafE family protein [Pyrodictium abyssi]
MAAGERLSGRRQARPPWRRTNGLEHHPCSPGGACSRVFARADRRGGSALGVPLLVYIVGLSPHHAVGASLVAVGAVSLISSVRYMRQGYVVYRIGLVMAAASLIGVYPGSYLNSYVKGSLLLLLFALLMIAIAARMLLRSKPGANTAPGRHAEEGA